MISEEKLVEVLEYMRVDRDDNRAVMAVHDAIAYLDGAGIKDDGSGGYMLAVKNYALAHYDGTELTRLAQQSINQQEILNEVKRYGL